MADINENFDNIQGKSEQIARNIDKILKALSSGLPSNIIDDFDKLKAKTQNVADGIASAYKGLEGGHKSQKDVQEALDKSFALSQKLANIQREIKKAGEGDYKSADMIDNLKDSFSDLGKVSVGTVSKTASLTGKIKNIGGSLNKFFATPGGLVTAGFLAIAKLAIDIQDQVVGISKALNMSTAEAAGLVREMNMVAVESNNINISGGRLLESISQINEQFGFIVNTTDEQLVGFTKLTKQVGLTAQEATQFLQISQLTGESIGEIQGDALETSRTLQEQAGIQMSQRQVMEEISKVSTATLLSNRGNVKALSEAVTQAKLLGTTMEAVEKIGSGLLDIETSIANEFKAELFLGRDLNLERARAAALQRDYATVAEEIKNQQVTTAEWSRLGAIGQQEFAAALNLSVDESAKMILQSEIMGKTREELVAMGRDDLVGLAERVSVSEKLGAATEKINSMFVSLGTILVPVVELIGTLAEGINSALSPFVASMASTNIGDMAGGTAAATVNNRNTAQDQKMNVLFEELIRSNKTPLKVEIEGYAVGTAVSTTTNEM